MIKLKNNKTKFIYTKSAVYINISCIVRFYLDRYDNSYHIDTCKNMKTAHSCAVVKYDISKDEYKKLEDMFKK